MTLSTAEYPYTAREPTRAPHLRLVEVTKYEPADAIDAASSILGYSVLAIQTRSAGNTAAAQDLDRVLGEILGYRVLESASAILERLRGEVGSSSSAKSTNDDDPDELAERQAVLDALLSAQLESIDRNEEA